MNDSRLTILSLLGFSLILVLALMILGWTLVRVLLNQHQFQTVENQRLRNQILAMGDLTALERLNRTTEVHREEIGNERSVYKGEVALNNLDPQDIINTPSGPVVMIDGVPTPLNVLTDDSLLAQGWADDGDVDFGVNPEGNYVPGRND